MTSIAITWTGGAVDYQGMYANYRRLSSKEKFTPPYTFEGDVKLNDVMYPAVFGWGWNAGQTATYVPKLNFHPLYPSNDRNIVSGPGNPQAPTVVGISAEMRDIRPSRPYGVRTGYSKRVRHPLPENPIGTGWHHFRWEVPSNFEYKLYWDDYLVADVVEALPATIDPGPVSVGLRLDFLDVEFKNTKVTQHMTTYTGTPRQVYDVDPVRILDTRQTKRVKARVPTSLPLTGRAPANASAIMVSVVVVHPSANGYVTLYEGGSVPGTSNINFHLGASATSGFAIVPCRSDGNMTAYSSAEVDLVIDMVGYLA